MNAATELTELFAVEGPRLRRFLRRFGPLISAEDIAQDSFAQLLAADLSLVSSPRAYLFRTARNLALNELRRRSFGSTGVLGDVAALERPSDTPSPEDFLISAEEFERLRSILELLPERQRSALLLFKVEGLSHKEIGQELGVSHRTVERYVADAIAECYDYLSAFRAED